MSVIGRAFLPSMHQRKISVISQHFINAVFKRQRNLYSSWESMRLLAVSSRTNGIHSLEKKSFSDSSKGPETVRLLDRLVSQKCRPNDRFLGAIASSFMPLSWIGTLQG